MEKKRQQQQQQQKSVLIKTCLEGKIVRSGFFFSREFRGGAAKAILSIKHA